MPDLHPEKRPFRIVRKFKKDGVPLVEYEADFFEGPAEPDAAFGYRTIRSVVSKASLAVTVSPTVSFYSRLAAAA